MKLKLSQTFLNNLHLKYKEILSKLTINQYHKATSDSVATIVLWEEEEEEVEKLITTALDLKEIGNSRDLFHKLKS